MEAASTRPACGQQCQAAMWSDSGSGITVVSHDQEGTF
jgi:hypothetical protein